MGEKQIEAWPGTSVARLPTTRSYAGLVTRQFLRHRPAVAGAVILTGFFFVAAAGPFFAPYDPLEFDFGRAFSPPSVRHLLGTDELGRDIFSRLVAGARITLTITFFATGLGLIIGTILGTLAGFYGGWLDDLLMRLVDVLLAVPPLLLAMALIAALGVGTENVILAVGISSIPVFARLARASTLTVRERDFILAGRALGLTNKRLVAFHILPNIVPTLIVQATLRLATAVLTASSLGFLGLGPQPPTPEWGAMLSSSRTYLTSNPYLILGPGLALLLVTLSFNLVGDGLRDALDPRLRMS
jgi:peptide/nickel transport system permease protein